MNILNKPSNVPDSWWEEHIRYHSFLPEVGAVGSGGHPDNKVANKIWIDQSGSTQLLEK